MNLSPQSAALLGVLNSARVALTEEVKKEDIALEPVMRQLLNVHTHACDSNEVPAIEQETLLNITKMLGATFIDNSIPSHKYKVAPNAFTDFLKSVEPPAAKEPPQATVR